MKEVSTRRRLLSRDVSGLEEECSRQAVRKCQGPESGTWSACGWSKVSVWPNGRG